MIDPARELELSCSGDCRDAGPACLVEVGGSEPPFAGRGLDLGLGLGLGLSLGLGLDLGFPAAKGGLLLKPLPFAIPSLRFRGPSVTRDLLARPPFRWVCARERVCSVSPTPKGSEAMDEEPDRRATGRIGHARA